MRKMWEKWNKKLLIKKEGNEIKDKKKKMK